METIDQYVMRLIQRGKQLRVWCESEMHVGDQVVDQCRSPCSTQNKFPGKGNDLTLDTLQTIARAHEAAEWRFLLQTTVICS